MYIYVYAFYVNMYSYMTICIIINFLFYKNLTIMNIFMIVFELELVPENLAANGGDRDDPRDGPSVVKERSNSLMSSETAISHISHPDRRYRDMNVYVYIKSIYMYMNIYVFVYMRVYNYNIYI
jgi:hypothetical protein